MIVVHAMVVVGVVWGVVWGVEYWLIKVPGRVLKFIRERFDTTMMYKCNACGKK